jgi:hypothetical protein
MNGKRIFRPAHAPPQTCQIFVLRPEYTVSAGALTRARERASGGRGVGEGEVGMGALLWELDCELCEDLSRAEEHEHGGAYLRRENARAVCAVAEERLPHAFARAHEAAVKVPRVFDFWELGLDVLCEGCGGQGEAREGLRRREMLRDGALPLGVHQDERVCD